MLEMRRKLFSALSWRVEARAAALPAAEGATVRHRWGRMMSWAGAHRSLPETTDRAAILCFHSITAHRPDPEVEADALDVRDLRNLLAVLRTSFHVIPLAELVDAVRQRRPPPSRSVVITFDDGYANAHSVAAEELARQRMPWSLFLPAMLIETGGRQWIDDVRILIHRGGRKHLSFAWDGQSVALDLSSRDGRRDAVTRIHQLCRYVPEAQRRARLDELYACWPADEMESLRAEYPSFRPMTWMQAQELQAAGVDVGSHALNHMALGPQPPEVVRHEVLAARALLQQRIGDHSPHFSYPYGRESAISDESERVLAAAGYHCALTLEQELVYPATTHPLRLPRLIVSGQVGRVLFTLWQRFIR